MSPQLGSAFSISMWARLVNTGTEGWIFTVARRGGTANDVVAAGTAAAITLSFLGVAPTAVNIQNRFALCGIDRAGNKFNATTLASTTTPSATGTGYGLLSESFEAVNGQTALLTVQYRAGNIELWATFRSMRPRLLIQQACTWTGTAGPMDIVFGGALTTSANAVIEMEMPIVLPDRALSENQIAQLADGISPETLNSASTLGLAEARFVTVTNGTTTAADTASMTTPADGQTFTVNGETFTFRTSPTLTNDVQIIANVTPTAVNITPTNSISSPTCPPNGQRVTTIRGTQSGGIDAQTGYFVVNSSNPGGAGTFQMSLTPGGAAITISTAGSGAITQHGLPATIDNLVAKINASAGAANVVTALSVNSDRMFLTSKTVGGTGVTLAASANTKLPSNARLATAWAYVLDYTNFRDGLFGATGPVRTRTAAWVAPSGTELAPNTQVTGSMRITSWTDGMVTNSVGGTSYLALTGIYTGNDPLSGGQLKFYDQNGNTQVQDFAGFTSFSINSGAKTWAGKLTAPAGKRWLSTQLKKTGSTQVTQQSEVRVGLGKLIWADGRSHATDWFNDYGGNDIAPNGFCSQFNGAGMTAGANGYFPIDNRWHRYDVAAHVGSGATVFSNKVSNDNNVCVGLISRAVGGVSFATLNDPAVWALRQADITNTWGDSSLMPLVDAFIWTHSGEDYGDTTTGLLPQLRTNVTTYFSASTKMGVTTSLTAGDSPDGTVLTGNVRTEHVAYKIARLAASDTSVFDAGDYSYVRANTTDGIHSTQVIDHKVKCETAAIGYNGTLTGVMNAATGPVISSVVRTGANIDITWNLNGATALQLPNAGNVSGTDVALASSNFLPLIGQPTADSTTDTFTLTGHGWSNGDPLLIVTNGGTQPGGVTTASTYFLINAATNTFQISATVGGAAVDITSNGSSIFAYNTKSLLTQTSHTITGANTTRIVLSADPGASVMVMHNFGRPGRQNAGSFDPTPALDVPGRSAMTALWSAAQGNFLNDNFARTYTTTTTNGRLARMTTAPITA